MTPFLIGIDSRFDLFALHVFSELIDIESNRSRVRIEQFAYIRSLGPDRLLPIQHVVHLPKTSLQSGGLGSQRGLASVLVALQRKIPKHNTQTRVILFHQPVDKTGETAAGSTLKIAEFFHC